MSLRCLACLAAEGRYAAEGRVAAGGRVGCWLLQALSSLAVLSFAPSLLGLFLMKQQY